MSPELADQRNVQNEEDSGGGRQAEEADPHDESNGRAHVPVKRRREENKENEDDKKAYGPVEEAEAEKFAPRWQERFLLALQNLHRGPKPPVVQSEAFVHDSPGTALVLHLFKSTLQPANRCVKR